MNDNENRIDYVSKITESLRSNLSKQQIIDLLDDYHENDLADVLEELTKEERLQLYDLIDPEKMSEIFAYLEDASEYIEEMDAEKAADIIEEMDVDDAIDLLEDLEDDSREELMEKLDAEAKQDINLVQSYEEDEIGSVMTTNFVIIDLSCNIRQAMRSLMEQAVDNDNIMTIYVQKHGHYYGAIDLKDLIIARENADLEDIITTSYPYVDAHEKIQDCLNYISDYSEDSIPVLDENRTVIGVITSQDILEMVDDEMGEDYAKLAGLTSEEDLEETTKQSIAKRIPWLLLLLVLGLGVSSVVGIFEEVVSSLTIVMAFQSLILGMAGNVGTQSLAVTIRALTDDELDFKTMIKLISKEVRIGLLNGTLLGIISFIFIGLYIHFIKHTDLSFGFLVSGCVGLAMLLSMVISSLTGTTIPIIFKKIGIDPAVASGPLITTVNDLVAVITYYGLAWLLLIQICNLAPTLH